MTATRLVRLAGIAVTVALLTVTVDPVPATAQTVDIQTGVDPDLDGGGGEAGDAITDWVGTRDFDTSGYDVGYEPGGFTDVGRKVFGPLLQMAYSLIKVTTAAAVAVVDWAFAARLSAGLADIVAPVADRYHAGLFAGPGSGYDLAVLVCCVAVGLMALRGRTTQAAGELATTWLVLVIYLAAVGGVPGGFARLITSLTDTADGLSTALVATTIGDAADGCGTDAAVACPLRQSFHAAFIVAPYDQLNYGADLGDASDPTNPLAGCAAARDQLVADGPHDTDDEPRTAMTDAGCQVQAAYQANPSADRLVLAAATAAISVVVLGVTLLIALTLIVAQLLLVMLVLVLPFVVLAGAVPATRSWLWTWLGGVGRVVLVTVALAIGLALYLVTIDAVMAATDQVSPLLQFVSLLAVTILMLWARHRLVKASGQAATAITTRLNTAGPGTTGGMATHAAAAFHAPGYHGLRPAAYVREETRQTWQEVRKAGRSVAGKFTSRPAGGP